MTAPVSGVVSYTNLMVLREQVTVFHSLLALSSKLSNVAVSVLQAFRSQLSEGRKQESKNTIIYIHHQAEGDK